MEQTFLTKFNLETESICVPNYIAVEGAIGVGKTTLTEKLASSLNYDVILEEPDENPFLEKFYRDKKNHALSVQLHFLFQRLKKLQNLRQGDIFQSVRVSDFIIEKDPIFAKITLDDHEYSLYNTVYENVITDLPKPDVVIYLQAPTSALMERVKLRGRLMEKDIDENYLIQLNDAYTHFFYHYTETPLLIVNTSTINLAKNERDYEDLVRYLLTKKISRNYYNPTL